MVAAHVEVTSMVVIHLITVAIAVSILAVDNAVVVDINHAAFIAMGVRVRINRGIVVSVVLTADAEVEALLKI